jgi:hypothetical protein
MICEMGIRGCSSRVHPSCYVKLKNLENISNVPDEWYCDRCEECNKMMKPLGSKEYACKLCGFGDWYVCKEETHKGWVHPVCHLAYPQYIPPSCNYCSYVDGVPARCFVPGCTRSFHIVCFLDKCSSQRKIFIDLPQFKYFVCFCEDHEDYVMPTNFQDMQPLLYNYFGLLRVPCKGIHPYKPPTFMCFMDTSFENQVHASIAPPEVSEYVVSPMMENPPSVSAVSPKELILSIREDQPMARVVHPPESESVVSPIMENSPAAPIVPQKEPISSVRDDQPMVSIIHPEESESAVSPLSKNPPPVSIVCPEESSRSIRENPPSLSVVQPEDSESAVSPVEENPSPVSILSPKQSSPSVQENPPIVPVVHQEEPESVVSPMPENPPSISVVSPEESARSIREDPTIVPVVPPKDSASPIQQDSSTTSPMAHTGPVREDQATVVSLNNAVTSLAGHQTTVCSVLRQESASSISLSRIQSLIHTMLPRKRGRPPKVRLRTMTVHPPRAQNSSSQTTERRRFIDFYFGGGRHLLNEYLRLRTILTHVKCVSQSTEKLKVIFTIQPKYGEDVEWMKRDILNRIPVDKPSDIQFVVLPEENTQMVSGKNLSDYEEDMTDDEGDCKSPFDLGAS